MGEYLLGDFYARTTACNAQDMFTSVICGLRYFVVYAWGNIFSVTLTQETRLAMPKICSRQWCVRWDIELLLWIGGYLHGDFNARTTVKSQWHLRWDIFFCWAGGAKRTYWWLERQNNGLNYYDRSLFATVILLGSHATFWKLNTPTVFLFFLTKFLCFPRLWAFHFCSDFFKSRNLFSGNKKKLGERKS